MKKYIKSNINLTHGSYVMNRDGKLYEIQMHVPSTTYLSRGITHLSPTDAEFLFGQGFINESEARAICMYCYEEYLEDEMGLNSNQIIPLTAPAQFSSYAELRYAPNVRILFFKFSGRTLEDIDDMLENLPSFDLLNSKWYKYLQNEFIKISIFGKECEIRISSDDGFNWNEIIIDDFLLKYDDGKSTMKYTILRESSTGYKAYFWNASLSDILENDKVVLSSELYDRKVINGRFVYEKVE